MIKMVKPENKKFKVNGQMVAIGELTLEQARKAKKYAHSMSNGFGWNDDARMQNYWISVENYVDARIRVLEAC